MTLPIERMGARASDLIIKPKEKPKPDKVREPKVQVEWVENNG